MRTRYKQDHLKVTTSQPCKVVYSLYEHSYLGYLFEPHIVQINSKGNYTLSHQRLFSNTAGDFDQFLDQNDYKLISILDRCDQRYIIKKYAEDNPKPADFFSNVYNEEMHTVVRSEIETNIGGVIDLLEQKPLFVMGKDGNPTREEIYLTDDRATVLFHFKRENGQIRYFPTIKYKEERISFIHKDAKLISSKPALMLLDNTLYQFEHGLDGKKLKPFLKKAFIQIPQSSEITYLKTFVKPLLEEYRVHAEGFEIINEKFEAKPVLQIQKVWNEDVAIALYFKYGDNIYPYRSSRKAYVTFNENNGSYNFTRIMRSLTWEQHKVDLLISLGLRPTEGSGFRIEKRLNGEEETVEQLDMFQSTEDKESSLKDYEITDWLQQNFDLIAEHGFEIRKEGDQQIYFTTSQLSFKIDEQSDWFDVKATVQFGKYEVNFVDLRNYILKGIREYILPGGEIAVIPEEWFAQFKYLFEFSNNSGSIQLKKYHVGIVQNLRNNQLAQLSIDRKLEGLSDFKEIEEADLPKNFKGKLRTYQKAGYDWLCFLNQYRFGGCLADDMGLGKTIQTLALLQKQKEIGEKQASLIVMPTSLIHNWEQEAAKFTPKLKVFAYTGTEREKDVALFSGYDLILTSYGIARLDTEILKQYYFNYTILDESQIIKNPNSQISKAVASLNSQFKLILSGTPIENSVMDLWSQLSFVNPGLLGLQTYFKDNFVIPIERDKDEVKRDKLHVIIKPFILRRTKKQVAKELPEKIEQVTYCEMSEEQHKYYEEVKSSYRNEILKSITKFGVAKSRISIIQGLTKLRQIANHPVLVDDFYTASSGKFEEVTRMVESVIAEGHKILLYSQFVKQLTLFRRYFDRQELSYAYLDGSTKQKDRRGIVEEFQNNVDLKLFLISLKAGGLGLNLTAADYVFIVDPWWNPAIEQQAVDRSHRIGQVNTVFTYKFIAKNTVEEKILGLQQRKSEVASQLIVTEESFFKSLSEIDIRSILE